LKKIKFAFGIHNHQPIGNFEQVFEKACKKCYSPFLELLEKYPFFKLSLHYCGILFDWLFDNHPELVEKLKVLVRKGQVELLTGGYYEPIFPVISDEDKIGQIEKLSSFIKQNFDFAPSGMWVAERVWEPHLPKYFAQAGVKFCLLDDSHFKYSGLEDEKLLGYYLTEEEGYPLALFPISKKLRYYIPFKEPEEIVDYLKSLSTEEGENLIVYADDGEKFGIWPNTFEHCYEDRWLERFFEKLKENLDWIEMVHFRQALKELSTLGRIYLPTASYYEMMHWALLPEAFQEFENFENALKEKDLFEKYGIFVRGGFWRNFLAKYPESNQMHKRMLYLNQKIKKLESSKNINKEKILQIRDECWKSQCNDPYWHGVFGGLYLSNLRKPIYEHLIRADKLIDELGHKDKNWIEYEVIDFDKDGKEEIIIESPVFNFYFAPQLGGVLYEMDFKPKDLNLLDILSRREEGYHRKLSEIKSQELKTTEKFASIHDLVQVKEDGLEKLLTYDWYRRGSFIDHFLGKNTKLDDFARCQYPEQGDFVNQPYEQKINKKEDYLKLVLSRSGFVWVDNQKANINLIKKISLKGDKKELKIIYELVNKHSEPVNLWFGIEFNFGMLSCEDERKSFFVKDKELKEKKLNLKSEDENIESFGIKDKALGLLIYFKVDRPSSLWQFPLYTVSLSESGFEKTYQSTILFPNWKIRLNPEEVWQVKIINRIDLL
jgi:alpha-amylase